ncbi:hypothetical protein PCAR4_290034 [Paraburkholderia caribensis]|nr:hypothetical protein PCAR4_290034 [Paraburkholderia caribensis]
MRRDSADAQICAVDLQTARANIIRGLLNFKAIVTNAGARGPVCINAATPLFRLYSIDARGLDVPVSAVIPDALNLRASRPLTVSYRCWI